MSVEALTNAIIAGINAGGEQFLEGTLAAVLPMLWLAIIGLRLGADLLWLVYVALRDLLIVSGVVMSFMFFFPDVVGTDALPVTGGLAAAALFGVLLVKLMGDPDHELFAFRLTSVLLFVGALCYFVPYLLGVMGSFPFSPALVTNTNPGLAVALAYVSVALLAIMGAIAAWYTLHTGGRPEEEEAVTESRQR